MNNFFNTPILLLVFNRPELTAKVFEQITNLKPSRLYIAADGPRIEKQGEEEKCAQTKLIVSKIDWKCEVSTLYRTNNLGCREAVSSAITWFFDHEEEGIILEDDCLPNTGFFKFCENMLEKYRSDDRIGHISGSNFQFGQQYRDGSYYFSRLMHIWGWASWKRAWKGYDLNISTLPKFKDSGLIYTIPVFSEFAESWLKSFDLVHAENYDTWDIQYVYHQLINGRIAIMPNVNLISNIGFNEDATHTKSDHPFANLPISEIGEIIHPSFLLPNTEADIFTLTIELDLKPQKPRLSRVWKSIKKFYLKL